MGNVRRVEMSAETRQALDALYASASGRTAKGYPTKAAEAICEFWVPHWREMFLKKNEGYGEVEHKLGPLAEIPHMERKMRQLERALWEGLPIGEDVSTVALDLIGHAFLLLYLLDTPNNAVRPDES